MTDTPVYVTNLFHMNRENYNYVVSEGFYVMRHPVFFPGRAESSPNFRSVRPDFSDAGSDSEKAGPCRESEFQNGMLFASLY